MDIFLAICGTIIVMGLAGYLAVLMGCKKVAEFFEL